MTPPNYPGTHIPMREKAHSESEVTPRTEHFMQVVHQAEEQRQSDISEVRKQISEMRPVIDRMSRHMDAAERREIEIETSRKKRNTRIKWAVVTIGAPVLVAVVGSGAAAWTQILVQSRAQASAVAAHAAQSAQPSTEDTYRAGFAAGSKAVVDEQLARLQANPSPIVKSPDRVASRAPTR